MRRKPYRARVKVDGVEQFIGRFSTEAEAQAAKEQFCLEHGIDTSPSAVAARSAMTRRMVYG